MNWKDTVAAHALVTLGALEDTNGNEACAQLYYEKALVEFAQVFDALLGCGLAAPALPECQFGPLVSVDVALEPLLTRMRRLIRDPLFGDSTLEIWRTFFRAILRDSGARELERIRQDPLIQRIVSRNGAAITEALTFFAAPVLPPHRRSTFGVRVRETLRLMSETSTSNVPTIAHTAGVLRRRLEA